MNLFQWITLPLLGLLLLHDLRSTFFRRPFFRRDRVIRCLIWLLAGVAIYDPGITALLANQIGIQRGADLLIYLVSLSFIATTFYFYSRSVRLERQITELVRHLAIKEARQGGTS